MSSPRDTLISALANGSPIDWAAIENPAWPGADVGERPSSAAGADRRERIVAFGRGALEVAWGGVIALSVLQVAVAVFASPSALPRPSSPTWLLLLNSQLFGLSGLLLVLGGRYDRRVGALGALLLLIAAAFAHPLLGRAGGSPDWTIRLLHSAPADAFLGTALWWFVWTFPVGPTTRAARRIGLSFLAISSGVGALLLAANLPEVWQGSMAVLGMSVPVALNRDSARSLYWLLVSCTALPALPYLVWKSRLGVAEECQRTRFFLVALIVGFSPMILAVIASIVVPALGATPWRQLTGSIAWAALASIVPTTAYAVLIDRLMEVRIGVSKATQQTVARYLVWLAGLGPILYLAIDLYVHRNVTLTNYFGQEGPFSLFLLLFVGFTALTFRSQMLRGVDHWFHRERADYAESLASLERDLRTAKTIRDVTGALAHQIERAILPASVAVLVVNEDAGAMVPQVGSVPPIAVDSVLMDLARSASVEIRSTLGPNSRIVPWLPPSDQAWLAEGGTHLVAPLVGSSGALLGLAALGQGQGGLRYTERDYAVVASMCGRAALQLENQWLRERPAQDGGTATPRERTTTVNWQNEPAEVCPRCTRVWPTGTRACAACGEAVAPAALPLLVKGTFRVERMLGSGGMGVVYLATDMTLGRKVALKTLPRVSDALAARLLHEARAMATVLHPHLALIYGAEQWRETPVLIVEYLEGGTLLDWLRRGPLTVGETLSLGIVLSDVLDRLHRTGVLHRDVKPSNIGYTMDGVPKLLDLGLAALFTEADREEPIAGGAGRARGLAQAPVTLDRPSGASSSGQMLGTLRYMSPEALGAEVPRPSFDLWSLSFVLYEALAGRHPFADLSPADVADRIGRSAIPDVRDLRPDCPPGLASFFRDALSHVATRRPATAADLRGLLQALQASTGLR